MTDTGIVGEDSFSEWLAGLGIHDRQSGEECAKNSQELLVRAAQLVIRSDTNYTTFMLVFSGLVARAQGLHQGTVAAIKENNPHAAFTLLRSYAETAAATLYLKDNPTQLENFWQNPRGVKIGVIINKASKHISRFKELYDRLSKITHPCPDSIFLSTKVYEDGRFDWSSGPRFSHDEDALVACAWVVEIAQITSKLLSALGHAVISMDQNRN